MLQHQSDLSSLDMKDLPQQLSKVLKKTQDNIRHLKSLIKALGELPRQSQEEKMLCRRLRQTLEVLECYQEHMDSSEENQWVVRHRLQQYLCGEGDEYP